MNFTKDKEKRRLNKFSIGCIIYLVLALLMSIAYLLATLNNQLETSEVTMGPVASVITFSCFMIIPPTVWLIVLICQKRLFFNFEIEQKIAFQKYEKSDLKVINDYVECLLSNKKLMKIIKNYVTSHTIPSWQLEFACLPLKEKFTFQTEQNKTEKHFKLNKWIQYIDINSTYINFVKNFNYDILEDNNSNVMAAYVLRDNPNSYEYLENIRSQFNELKNLFITLQNQRVIDTIDDKLYYYSFLFVIYSEDNKKFYEQALKRLEAYNINVDAPDYEIIEKLFNNDIEQGVISTTLWALYNGKNNFNNLNCISYNEKDLETTQVLKELKEKEKIANLLDDKKHRAVYDFATIDLMSGEQFEQFVTYLFNSLGYKANNTKLSGDQGIDVLAKKGKTIIAIQAKCYSKPVGNHAIMEAVAGAKFYKADKIMVVTNNTFTKSARELAESNNVILWDRNILKEKLEEI